MRFSNRTRGFSLLELSLVFILAAILLSLALPSWRDFLDRGQDQRLLNHLTAALQMARQQALLRHQVISLCPSRDQMTCSAPWQAGLLVFIDREERGQVEQENQILRIIDLGHFKGSLHWRAFPHSYPYCQFLPSGRTLHENGTFWYCSSDQAKPAWSVVISQSGRIRQVDPEKGTLSCHSRSPCHSRESGNL